MTSLPKQKLVELYREAMAANLPLEEIEAALSRRIARVKVASEVEQNQTDDKVKTLKKTLPLPVRVGAFILPVVMISLGLFLVGNAALPLMAYYTSSLPFMGEAEILSPLPKDRTTAVIPTNSRSSSGGEANAFGGGYAYSLLPTIIDSQLDYTNLANWFSGEAASMLKEYADDQVEEYFLDIPKLGIENARIVIGGTDLDQSLIQYPGTANPGRPGAPVIFGHSVLRQFYNPSIKNPRRYISIFSTIMTLEPGDEIILTYKGASYRYLMQSKTEVKPEDVHILLQNYDAHQLKLVTCTPEGTYLRRGVVTAQLVTN